VKIICSLDLLLLLGQAKSKKLNKHIGNHIAIRIVTALVLIGDVVIQAIVVEVAEGVLALDSVVGGDEAVSWLHWTNVGILVVFC